MGPPLANGGHSILDFGRYQVQMHGKGSIVRMLQRRLGVSKANTASVGDSMGDVGMFQESACAVLFNPWDDRPRKHAHHIIEEKDLNIVLDLICETFQLRNLDSRARLILSMAYDDFLTSICPHCGFLLVPSFPECRALSAVKPALIRV